MGRLLTSCASSRSKRVRFRSGWSGPTDPSTRSRSRTWARSFEVDEDGAAEFAHVAEPGASRALRTPGRSIPRRSGRRSSYRWEQTGPRFRRTDRCRSATPGSGGRQETTRTPGSSRKVDRRPAQERDQVPGRGGLEPFTAPAHLEVLWPLALRGCGSGRRTRNPSTRPPSTKQQFIRAFLGLDDNLHGAIRSWIV